MDPRVSLIPGGSTLTLFTTFPAMDTATIASTSSGKTVVPHDDEQNVIHDKEHAQEFRKERYMTDVEVAELLSFELDPKPQGYYTRYPNGWMRIRCVSGSVLYI